LIPDAKKEGEYTLYSEIQEDGGEDVVHLFLFDKVKKVMGSRFKKDLSDLDAYTGIPRGRVMEPATANGTWRIGIGNDFPLEKYKSDILSEFSMQDANSIGHVKFEYDAHEVMNVREKKEVEGILGIDISPDGWKWKKKK